MRSRPRPEWVRRACGGLVLAACLAATAAQAAGPSHAPPATLARARAAWDEASYDVAEPKYAQALSEGGLTPDEVLDAYVHLGAARAITGKSGPALEAFRIAALLDPAFEVPAEAGKSAALLATRARKEKARAGKFNLTAEVPSSVKPGSTFTVTVTVDAAHLALVSKLGIFAQDPVTKKTFTDTRPAAERATLEVGAQVTLPGAALVVRVDALDGHDNRLASTEQRVTVTAAEKTATTDPKGKTGKETPTPEKQSSKGFWSTAWPWVLGGVAALAGGAAAWYFGVQRNDDVSVGAARVTLVR